MTKSPRKQRSMDSATVFSILMPYYREGFLAEEKGKEMQKYEVYFSCDVAIVKFKLASCHKTFYNSKYVNIIKYSFIKSDKYYIYRMLTLRVAIGLTLLCSLTSLMPGKKTENNRFLIKTNKKNHLIKTHKVNADTKG